MAKSSILTYKCSDMKLKDTGFISYQLLDDSDAEAIYAAHMANDMNHWLVKRTCSTATLGKIGRDKWMLDDHTRVRVCMCVNVYPR